MIPELGKYAITVLSAYGLSLVLLLGLVVVSYRRWRSVKSELAVQEKADNG